MKAPSHSKQVYLCLRVFFFTLRSPSSHRRIMGNMRTWLLPVSMAINYTLSLLCFRFVFSKGVSSCNLFDLIFSLLFQTNNRKNSCSQVSLFKKKEKRKKWNNRQCTAVAYGYFIFIKLKIKVSHTHSRARPCCAPCACERVVQWVWPRYLYMFLYLHCTRDKVVDLYSMCHCVPRYWVLRFALIAHMQRAFAIHILHDILSLRCIYKQMRREKKTHPVFFLSHCCRRSADTHTHVGRADAKRF